MLPVARSVLRRIGDDSDVVTFVSRYTRGRFASAFGPRAALEHLPPGVDTDRFRPDPASRAELRARYGLGERPTVLCLSRLVPRKGQDMLIRALPAIRQRVDGAALVIVGGGPYLDTLRGLARAIRRQPITSRSPAAFRPPSCPPTTRWPTCSRCRAAPAAPDWTSKGWASSSWKPRPPACRWSPGSSGGAPETVLHNQTGLVVDGRSVQQIADAVSELLADPDRAAAMGAAGREWVTAQWRWDDLAGRLSDLIRG